MATSDNSDSGNAFAIAFGNALRNFLNDKSLTQVEAAARLGLRDKKTGKPNKSRLNSYLSDSPPAPGAEVLYLACTKLEGFNFSYNGYRINAETVGGNGSRPTQKAAEQLPLEFNRQFNLTDKKGAVTEKGAFIVKVRRPPGRIELSVSLKAARPF
jgi:transcriptional regulator with XRE-family HTH domain